MIFLPKEKPASEFEHGAALETHSEFPLMFPFFAILIRPSAAKRRHEIAVGVSPQR